jgi:hypothetical protein
MRYSRLAADPHASPPLPEQELPHCRNMLMLLWNVARVDRLAAIPPKADILGHG